MGFIVNVSHRERNRKPSPAVRQA